MKIKWGVIGCGGIALRRTIPGMMLSENSELVAVMDTNFEAAEKVKEEFGAKYAFSSASARQNLHIKLTPIPVFDRERRTRIRSEANTAFLLGCRQMHLAHIGNGDGEEVLALAQVVLGAAQGVVDIHLVEQVGHHPGIAPCLRVAAAKSLGHLVLQTLACLARETVAVFCQTAAAYLKELCDIEVGKVEHIGEA